MNVKITSDSTCDLSKVLIERYGIGIIPLSVSLGNQIFKDGLEMKVDDIYTYVEQTKKLPSTSAVNINDYICSFKEFTDKGTPVVHISLSSEFSSTYQNACIAAKEVGNVYVVDSRNLSTGQGLIVLKAAEMAAAGNSAEEIYRECNSMTSRVEASFVIDSLDFLYKGGRCSGLAVFGANIMHIKPCIVVESGKMQPEKKYRGQFEKIILRYVEDRLNGRDDIDYTRIFLTHTKCTDECVSAVKNKIIQCAPQFEEIIETTAGSTITTHCGPNTLGILFLRKK